MLLLLICGAAFAQDAVETGASLLGGGAAGLGGGAAVALLLDRVLRRGTDNSEVLTEIQQKTADLHEWHSREDSDGVKVWYIRPSLISALESLGEVATQLSANQQRSFDILNRIATVVERLEGTNRPPTDGGQ